MKPVFIVSLVAAHLVVAMHGTLASAAENSWAATMVAARQRALGKSVAGSPELPPRSIETPRLLQWFWERFPETDWFLQDQASRPHEDALDSQHVFGWYFQQRTDADGEVAMIRRALSELQQSADKFVSQLDALLASDAGPDNVGWLDLYVRICQQRRAERLQSCAGQVPRVVFTKHYTLGGSHYAYTEGQSDAQAERHFLPGAELCLLEWDGQDYRTKTLISDPAGVIRDPDVSFDGRRVLFSWKKSDREDDYHLYEMEVETEQVRQLTFGLGAADYEGAYLPDGDIVFNSTRCVQTVDCWWTEVSNLYRCDRNGEALRRLAFDQVHDNFPTVTQDGRILYTRWEYNDRGQVYPQPLLQMNADGTNQREFYGGNSWFPTTILHARAIPGGTKVLAIATGHHTRQTGKLIEIDPSQGTQENDGVALVAPPRATPGERIDKYGQTGELFQYPYPLDEQSFLVTYHPVGWPWAHGAQGPRFGIYWMSRDGKRELLAYDDKLPCSQPIPLKARTQRHVRPSQVDYRRTTGTCYIQDVYEGPGLAGVPRGTVKRLRVIAIAFRAAGIGSNRNSGPGGGALISTPVAIGNGAWDPKSIIGDATVHADGSAYFVVPARTPVYFQLLDAEGQMVQTMRSWTTLQPHENVSCVGCHEQKTQVPNAQGNSSLAMAAGAQQLESFYGPARGFSFVKEVQPILDRHCVSCHKPQEPICDLTGAVVTDSLAKRNWSRAYLELTHSTPDNRKQDSCWRGEPEHAIVNWVSSQSAPPMLPPRTAGASTSKLMAQLRAGHEGVQLTREELDKLAAWIDLGVPFCGDYVEAHAWNAEEQAKYRHFAEKRQRHAEAELRQIKELLERE